MINKRIFAFADKIMADFRSSEIYNHNPTMGEAREDTIIDYLSKLLPFKYGITRGIIISANNENLISDQSRQQDIIIYDKFNCPRLFAKSKFDSEILTCVPIESVLCTIEVKSRLTTEAIKDAELKYQSVIQMPRHELSRFGWSFEGGVYKPFCFLFAFLSDISLHKAAMELNESRKRNDNIPHILGIVSLDKGIVCYSSRADISKIDLNAADSNVMVVERENKDYHEVLLIFSFMLINTLNQTITTMPDLCFYMNNSDLKFSNKIFVSHDFLNDETYRIIDGKQIRVKQEFEGCCILNQIYKTGMSDMDLMIDDDLSKRYLFALYKFHKAGTLSSELEKIISTLNLNNSFEDIINRHIAGENVLVEPAIISEFQRQMIIGILKVFKENCSEIEKKLAETTIQMFESDNKPFITNFIRYIKFMREKQTISDGMQNNE